MPATDELTTEKGKALEARVAKLLRREGRWRVRTNVMVADRFGNTSELDVTHGLLLRHAIECKNYARRSVPLEDVAKFKEVLRLNGIPTSRGTFVTTSTFSPRARHIGVRCIDGTELVAWERRALVKCVLRRGIYISIAAGAVAMAYDPTVRHQGVALWQQVLRPTLSSAAQYSWSRAGELWDRVARK